MLHLVRPRPDLRERVWGGTRLGPHRRLPIGEAWLAGPDSEVAEGLDAGRTLDQLAARDGARLIGHRAVERTGDRFPLLVKLLDPTEWLSVQVHPDDELARRLEGPDAVGKTEAWFVLDTAPGAELLLGARDDVTEAAVREAISAASAGGEPRVAPLLRRLSPTVGTAYLVPAGTLHAVGPGLLVYELQQPSDITYRCEDWGRPGTAQRPIHTAQAMASVAVDSRPDAVPASTAWDSVPVSCEHFVLERVRLDAGMTATFEPGGATLHIVTALGPIRIASTGDQHETAVLSGHETVIVPAEWPAYTIHAQEPAGALIARVV